MLVRFLTQDAFSTVFALQITVNSLDVAVGVLAVVAKETFFAKAGEIVHLTAMKQKTNPVREVIANGSLLQSSSTYGKSTLQVPPFKQKTSSEFAQVLVDVSWQYLPL